MKKHYEVWLSSLQENAEVILASSKKEAINKAIKMALIEYPGFFCDKAELVGEPVLPRMRVGPDKFLFDSGYPIVKRITWS